MAEDKAIRENSGNKKLKILLVCNYDYNNASMVLDHINSLYLYSKHEIFILSGLIENNGNPNYGYFVDENKSKLDLNYFDVVVIHYSIVLCLDSYLSTKFRHQLTEYKGVKAIFLQDEYRFIHKTISAIKETGIDIVFSCVPKTELKNVYGELIEKNILVENVLTGYVSEFLQIFPSNPIEKRKYDISYRGRQYPLWHGRLGLEKWSIAHLFLVNEKKYGWNTNISLNEKDRLYGIDWINLLNDSKAVLGVETGASVFDFDGSVSTRVELKFNLLGKEFSQNFDENLTNLNSYRAEFFKNVEDQYKLNQISPRIFEAISMKTLLILYEGEYSGILKPWIHYLPVKKDHSNLDEIHKTMQDTNKIIEIISNAYVDVVLSEKYSNKNFVKHFDRIISSKVKNDFTRKNGLLSTDEYYTKNEIKIIFNPYLLSTLNISKFRVRIINKLKGIIKKIVLK